MYVEDIFAHITRRARRKMPSAAKVPKEQISSLEFLTNSKTMKEPKDIALESETASTSHEKDLAQPASGKCTIGTGSFKTGISNTRPARGSNSAHEPKNLKTFAYFFQYLDGNSKFFHVFNAAREILFPVSCGPESI